MSQTISVRLHELIDRHNVLHAPTTRIRDYMHEHPAFFKVVLLVNHIFRAVAMAGFMAILPFSLAGSLFVCFAGSLFYRLTVETNCAYKYALPAFAGSVAFLIGKNALISLTAKTAFASFSASVATLLATVPLTAYFAYIVLTVSYDVDQR